MAIPTTKYAEMSYICLSENVNNLLLNNLLKSAKKTIKLVNYIR